jgi:hypothetical protein
MLFILVLVLLFLSRVYLPEMVGRLLWPVFLPLRRMGRFGLCLSWIGYLCALGAIATLILLGYEMGGGQVVHHRYETAILLGCVLGIAIVESWLGNNPSKALDQWVTQSENLLERLAAEDIALLTSSASSPTVLDDIRRRAPTNAYLDHLRRMTRQVPASAPVRGYAWSIALNALATEIRRVESKAGTAVQAA